MMSLNWALAITLLVFAGLLVPHWMDGDKKSGKWIILSLILAAINALLWAYVALAK